MFLNRKKTMPTTFVLTNFADYLFAVGTAYHDETRTGYD